MPLSPPAQSGLRFLLLCFAPVSAEYLAGYDDTIGNPVALIFGLTVVAPPYGAPALLIRELTRRGGRGWPTMLLLGAAFGLFQADLIDQSLFDPYYRDIPRADRARRALSTDRSRCPWLSRRVLAVVAVLAGAAGAFVLDDALASESFRPSAGQIALTAPTIAGLVVAAFACPTTAARPRARGPRASVPAPHPGAVPIVALGQARDRARTRQRGRADPSPCGGG